MLSEEMKRFGEIARRRRIDFIKAKLTKETLRGVWQSIPITHKKQIVRRLKVHP